MRANRERLLHKLPTVAACLRGIAGVHSDDLMSSTCSLGFKDVEELTPARVHDGLGKVMVLHHSGDLKVFHRDMVIGLSVLLGDFEMVIVALALDLQMRLGGFAVAITALLAAAHRTLFASERSLRCPIIAWVVYGMPSESAKKDFSPTSMPISACWQVLGRCSAGGSVSQMKRAYQCPSARKTRCTVLGVPSIGRCSLILRKCPIFLGMMRCFWSSCKYTSLTYCLSWMECQRFGFACGDAPINRASTVGRDLSPDSRSEKALERLSETISQHLRGGGRNLLAHHILGEPGPAVGVNIDANANAVQCRTGQVHVMPAR